MSRDRQPSWHRPQDWAAYGLLTVVVLVTFANGMTGQFLWDDTFTVVNNVRTHGWSHLPEIFGIGDASFRYRAVRDASYVLDYSVAGLKPVVYHLFNALYHAITTCLVYALMRRLAAGGTAALFAALVFAVHPVHVDAVTYISGRRDILSSLFYLASLLAYMSFRQGGRWRWFITAGLLGALGVMTKEMAATFPAAWALYDMWLARRAGASGLLSAALFVARRHWHLYGLGLLGAGGFIAYVVLFQSTSAGAAPHGGSWAANFMTEVVVLAHGVRLFLWPHPLMLDYDGFFTPVVSLADGRLWVALGALTLLLAIGIRVQRASATGMLALHWLWLSYLPVMQLIPHVELFAEHYLYLPSVGACMLVGLGVGALLERPGMRRPVGLIATVLMLTLAMTTIDRNRDFSDPVAVIEAQLPYHPGARALNNLAFAYQHAGRLPEAVETWERRLEIRPDDVDGWVALGSILRAIGRAPEAVPAYHRALVLAPDNLAAWTGLGIAHQLLGQLDKAEQAFLQVLQRDPKDGDAWNNLGIINAMVGRWPEAERAFSKALEAQYVPPDAYLNLAKLLLRQRRCDATLDVLALGVSRGAVANDSTTLAALISQGRQVCGTPEQKK